MHKRKQMNELGKVPAARNISLTSRINLGELTVGDLQAVIDTEFPVSKLVLAIVCNVGVVC